MLIFFIGTLFLFVMKKFLFSLLFLALLACQGADSERASQEVLSDSISSSLDSLPSLNANSISKDSFLLSLLFKDVNGRVIAPNDSIALFMGGTDTILFALDSLLPLNILCPIGQSIELYTTNDSFLIPMQQKGGVEVKKEIYLSDWVALQGRIMDVDGTPHQAMPIKLHAQYKKRESKANYSNDLSFQTDSLGYYSVTIPSKARKVVLRCCGFLVGEITKKEWMNYPTHNFLFNPFELENLCSDSIPEGEFTVIVPSESGWENPELIYKNRNDWNSFFQECEVLEQEDLIAIQFETQNLNQTKKIRKRNAYFRDPIVRICLK